MEVRVGEKRKFPGITDKFPGHFCRCILGVLLLVANVLILTACSDEYESDKLYFAITSNNLEAVKEVLEKNPQIDYEKLTHGDSTPFSDSDHRALGLALTCADDCIVEMLLESGHVDVNSPNDITYLDEVICDGSVKLAEILLNHGAKVNGGKVNTINELIYCISPKMKDPEERAKLLLNNGAKIDSSTILTMLENEWRYLYIKKLVSYADDNMIEYTLPKGVKEAVKGDDEGLKLLLENEDVKSSKDTVLFASAFCSASTLQSMQNLGYDFNIVDDTGLSPLHVACMCNEKDAVEFLLNMGLDINQTTQYLMTPITCAVIGGNSETVDYLRNQGYSFQNGEVYTYLDEISENASTWDMACSYGSEKSIMAMLNQGYEPSSGDCYYAYAFSNDSVFYSLTDFEIPFEIQYKDENSLYYAPEDHFEWLIANNAQPIDDSYAEAVEWHNYELLKKMLSTSDNKQSYDDALEAAIERGEKEALSILIDHGVDVNQKIKDSVGRTTTLLHLAAASPSENIVKYLLSQGADPTVKDEDGMLPIDYAKEYELVENEELLKEAM